MKLSNKTYIRDEVFHLRFAGFSMDEIAKEIGISKSLVSKILNNKDQKC